MGYLSWFEEHANAHKRIVDKLLSEGKTKEEIIEYFEFENMVKNEPDFCSLYAQNRKCHDMEALNCYLCACPNFRFKDDGIKKIEDKMQYSFCAIDSKDGRQGVYGEKIHQDCSRCTVPHHRSYVEKHFDLDWKKDYAKVHPLMGVNIELTLEELRTLFPAYNFSKITATSDGVIDTTYIVTNTQTGYILKHFDRDISGKISHDKKLLQHLQNGGLNVPKYLDEKEGWYLFSKLKGSSPKNIQLYHIQALGRFMAKYHTLTYKDTVQPDFVENYPIKNILHFTKNRFYLHYKKLETLKHYKPKNDGFIHGDIFKDNTIFEGEKMGVFDFIDGGSGEFAFDIAVALISFNPKNKPLFTNAFLRTYNQNAPKKVTLSELQAKEILARQLYALLRIERYKGTAQARELI